MHSGRKVYQVRKSVVKSDSVQSAVIRQLPEFLRALMAEQKILHKKIHAIDDRLRFGYSEPLHDYRTALVRDDIFLSAKIMDELLKLHS